MASDFPTLQFEVAFDSTPGSTAPVWTDVTYDGRSFDVNRGRSRELDQFQAGRLSVVLDNRKRWYDPQHTGTATQYVDLPGTSGNYASTPDSAAVSITGDIDIRVKVALDDWTPATERALAARFEGSSQRSYYFSVNTSGNLRFVTTSGGTDATAIDTNRGPTGFTDGTTHWVRVTRDVDNGASGNDTKFYTSDDGVTWVQLGTTSTSAGTTSIFDGTAALEVGSRLAGTTNPMAGNVYYAEVRSGIDGPVHAKFDANRIEASAVRTPSTVNSTIGETWTINGSAWQWGTIGERAPYDGNVKPMKRIRLRAIWAGTVYDLFSGFVDSWDQDYEMTDEATCTVTATDGFKVWERAELPSVYFATIRDAQPKAWWVLSEGVNATSVVDYSGSGYTLDNVEGTPTFGTESLAVGEPGTSVTFTSNDDTLYRESEFILTTGPLTYEIVYKHTTGAQHGRMMGMVSNDGNSNCYVNTQSDGDLDGFIGNGGSVAIPLSTGASVVDGEIHHIVLVWNDDGTIKFYIDGVDRTSGSPSLAVTAFTSPSGRNFIGRGLPTGSAVVSQGAHQFAAFYDRALTPAEITAHNEALTAPWNGDTTGERIENVADEIGWPTADRDIDTGESTLQSADIGGVSALAHAQLVAKTEFGEFFFTPDGKIRFVGRHDKWLAPYNDPLFTLSDDGSDLGYRRLKFNYDDQLIRNRVTISYDNGRTFTANSTSSQDDFLIQSFSQTGLIGDVDSEAVDYANYVLNRYDEPLLRVQGVTITPQRNPATHFPEVLSADLVFQVNVERTPQSIGSAIDLNYTIEGVSHRIEPKFWRTDLQLSPADTPGAFILDSTSQGVLNQNALGW